MIKKTLCLLLLIATPCAHAAEAVTFLAPAQLAPHRETIVQVEQYLSGLTTITSEFTQVAPDGSLSEGAFYLQRPGKMRWQYKPPTPILIVANGSDIVYYDSELEQITHIPSGSTVIGFLARDKIRFDKDVGIVSFEENAGTIRIGVAQRDKPTEGQLVLEFSDKPLLIRTMIVTDAGGQITTVSLNNANFGAPIDKALFDFRDPRQPKKRL